MNTEPMTVRGKVAVELGTIAVLTSIFLLLFPRRNPMVDVALAGFALLCIGATARYTKRVVWGVSQLLDNQEGRRLTGSCRGSITRTTTTTRTNGNRFRQC